MGKGKDEEVDLSSAVAGLYEETIDFNEKGVKKIVEQASGLSTNRSVIEELPLFIWQYVEEEFSEIDSDNGEVEIPLNVREGVKEVTGEALENSGVDPEGAFNIKDEKSQRDLSKMILEALKAIGGYFRATVTYLGKSIADAGEAIFQSIAKAVRVKSQETEIKSIAKDVAGHVSSDSSNNSSVRNNKKDDGRKTIII